MRRHIAGNATLLTIAALAIVTAAARMPFWLATTNSPFARGDATVWQVWSRSIYEHGFINVFRTAESNNVGYHYVLWPTSVIYGWISPDYQLWTPAIQILIKVPPFLSDIGLAVLIFVVARMLSPARTLGMRNLTAAGAALAFALAPAVIYDSMWWSQIDSVITIFMLASVVLLARGRVGLAWALWTVGFLIKPQPIVMVPPLAAFTFWQYGLLGTARAATGVAAVAIAALGPFLLHGDAVRIWNTYELMFQQWPLDLSLGAWNGWSILDARGDPRPDQVALTLGPLALSYTALALLLCVPATLVALGYLRRNQHLVGLLVATSAMVFAFYMLPASTHERYLYPMFALAAPLLVRLPYLIPGYAVLSATFFLNLVAINPPNASEIWLWHGTDVAIAVAALHIALYAATLAWLWFGAIPLRRSPPARLVPDEALARVA